MDRDYDVTIFVSKYFYWADITKITIMFIEKTILTIKENKKNCNFYIKMHFLYVFPGIIKIIDFRWKNVDIGGTQGVSHVMNKFSGSSLGKI